MPLLIYKEDNIIKEKHFSTRQKFIDYIKENNPTLCNCDEIFAYMKDRKNSNFIESDGIKNEGR